MKELLLDTRTIIENPNLFGLNSPDYFLTTTDAVIEEIRKSGTHINISYNDRLELIQLAVDGKTIKIISTLDKEIDFLIRSISSLRLSYAEKGLLAYIIKKQQNGELVSLVTKSKLLKKFAINSNIDLLSIKELNGILESIPKEEPKPENLIYEIQEYSKKENKKIFYGFIGGFILGIIAFIIYININFIVSSINVWTTIILTIILSFVLYLIREKWRLPYGFLEFSVGVFSIVILFYPSRFNFNLMPLDSTFFIKIIGGLYIMVRGIDNMMKAIKDTQLGLSIKDLFALNS
ncbi:MAG: hypothetical protein ABI091_06480 [Ferruginibacter sp.]